MISLVFVFVLMTVLSYGRDVYHVLVLGGSSKASWPVAAFDGVGWTVLIGFFWWLRTRAQKA